MGLTYEISKNPESFPLVPGSEVFRLGKTDAYGVAPRLRVIFEILDNNRVLLAAVRAEGEGDFFEWF